MTTKNTIKSLYISTYITLLAVVSIHSAMALSETGWNSVWTGVLIAVVPSLLFFVQLFLKPVARTSANLNLLPIMAFVGAVLSFILANDASEQMYAYLYSCGLGVSGSLLYIYWYSRFGRKPSSSLVLGQALPDFYLKTSTGESWSSSAQEHHPALMLFFRGNWCPLCMAQIKEVASLYQELEGLGVKVYLVSPQPDSHTRALASKFEVNFSFMVDENNGAAKQLGIEAEGGTPKGLEVLGYDSDTVLPTAILTDSTGKVIFLDQTDNYRVRPEPETFIRVFKEHGLSANRTS